MSMGFEDYEDDAGYSGISGIGDFDLDTALDVANPFTAISNAASFITGGDNQDVIDQNSVAQAGAASDQQIAQSMTPAGGFPGWAGSPQTFMGRVTKLNAVMGTNFAVNTSPTDSQLMGVVRSFQSSAGLSADGEMGAKTEAALDARLGGSVAPVTPPAAPLAVVPQNPSPVDPGTPGGLTPASATDASGDKTKMLIAVGVGGVLLLGLAYFALKD